MSEFKKLSRDAIPAAIERAVRYRVLNEPLEAESICLDILAIDPDNEDAMTTLILALSDQFGDGLEVRFTQAREMASRLSSEYERLYHEGIICERRAKVHMRSTGPRTGFIAYGWFRKAMELYERAEELRSPGNDESILRWNACVRILARYDHVRPSPDDDGPPLQLE